METDDIRALVYYRLEQASNALEDARLLAAARRPSLSIVNRSYYAMFYAALALLQDIGAVPRKHAGVLSLFDTEFVLKSVSL